MLEKLVSERLMSRAEAAEYLGLSAHTLAIWKSTGRVKLPVVKIGGLAKYKRSDLDAFIAANRINSADQAA